MTGTDCVYLHKNQSRSYLNHLVVSLTLQPNKREANIAISFDLILDKSNYPRFNFN
jgi:hypothetical protein